MLPNSPGKAIIKRDRPARLGDEVDLAVPTAACRKLAAVLRLTVRIDAERPVVPGFATPISAASSVPESCRGGLDELNIPMATCPVAEEIIGITGKVCAKLSDAEYASLARQVVAKLARKRPSPLIEKAPKDGEGRIVSLDPLTCELNRDFFARRRAAMTVVFDAGQNSGDNFAYLAGTGLRYVGPVPASDCPDLTALPASVRAIVDQERSGRLTAYETRRAVYGTERRVMLTYSPGLHESQARGFTGTTLAKAGQKLDELAAVLARGKTRRPRARVEADIAAITRTCWPCRSPT